jgi:hypothetical protein
MDGADTTAASVADTAAIVPGMGSVVALAVWVPIARLVDSAAVPVVAARALSVGSAAVVAARVAADMAADIAESAAAMDGNGSNGCFGGSAYPGSRCERPLLSLPRRSGA